MPSISPRIRRYGLSPRGRGKLMTVIGDSNPSRSIPAWAGETISVADMCITATVYPRVGGGNRR